MLARVFVYGTLKPEELQKPSANEYQRSCLSSLLKSEPAIAYGDLFDLPLGYPAMVLGNTLVYGFLLTFSNSNILTLLDEYEGYDPYSNDNEYERILIEIFSPTQASLGSAWTYVMNRESVDRLQGIHLPNGIWTSK